MGMTGKTYTAQYGEPSFFELANRWHYRTQFNEGVLAAIASMTTLDTAPEIDMSWEMVGTNGESTLSVDGTLINTSGTAENDESMVRPHLNAAVNLFNISGNFTAASAGGNSRRPRVRWAISVASALTNMAWQVGFGETAALTAGAQIADGAEKAVIGFDTSTPGTNLHFGSSIAGTDTVADSNVLMETGRTYVIDIELDGKFYPHYWINGDYIGKGALVDSSTYFAPYAAITDLKATSGFVDQKLALAGMEYSRLWDHTIDVAPPGGIVGSSAEGRF